MALLFLALNDTTNDVSLSWLKIRTKEVSLLATPDIVLTRIDNRLVHGQVGVVWTSALGINLVANDEVANDDLQQELMAATAETSDVGIRFWTIDKTIKTIHKASPRQHIFLVVRNPQDALRLVEGGVPIKKINVGNMHFTEGKEAISKKVYVDQNDRDTFNKLVEQGVDVFIQDVPDSSKKEITKL